MKLEEQVSNLELSKRLKALGVKQDAYFCWIDQGDGSYIIPVEDSRVPEKWEVSAFTVAELAKDMPPYSFTLYWEDNLWRCGCSGVELKYRLGITESKGYNEELRNYYGDNAADLLAKLKINLIESGLVKNTGKE